MAMNRMHLDPDRIEVRTPDGTLVGFLSGALTPSRAYGPQLLVALEPYHVMLHDADPSAFSYLPSQIVRDTVAFTGCPSVRCLTGRAVTLCSAEGVDDPVAALIKRNREMGS